MKNLILILLGMLLFAAKSFCQSQEFTVLRFTDKTGIETRQERTKITLLTGVIEITEQGQTFKEQILTQTKGTSFCRVTTNAGEYTFLFDGAEIYAVHLRSLIGADRSYLNPLK